MPLHRAPLAAALVLLLFAPTVLAGKPPQPGSTAMTCIVDDLKPGPSLQQYLASPVVPVGFKVGLDEVAVSFWHPNWWETKGVCDIISKLLKCLKDPDTCKKDGVADPELAYWDGMGATYDGTQTTTVTIADPAYPGAAGVYTMTTDEFLGWYGY